jgi:hypothetical protein
MRSGGVRPRDRGRRAALRGIGPRCEGNANGLQGRLASSDDDVEAVWLGGHVADGQSAVAVFADAEEAKESQKGSAPDARVLEVLPVEDAVKGVRSASVMGTFATDVAELAYLRLSATCVSCSCRPLRMLNSTPHCSRAKCWMAERNTPTVVTMCVSA